MKKGDLEKPILIINRHDYSTELVIYTKKTYDEVYKQICEYNDVKQAIKVFCDLQNKTEKELLQEFNLVELINCFSTRFLARTVKDNVVEYSEVENDASN